MAGILRAASSIATRNDHVSNPQAVPTFIRCAIHHRLGVVPVGQPSIGTPGTLVRTPADRADFWPSKVIAVSSPHRKESFVACEFILEEVKRKAQIWKREFYEGEDSSTAEWKENN